MTGQLPAVVRVPTFQVHEAMPLLLALVGARPDAVDGPDLYSTTIVQYAPGLVSTVAVAYPPGFTGELSAVNLRVKLGDFDGFGVGFGLGVGAGVCELVGPGAGDDAAAVGFSLGVTAAGDDGAGEATASCVVIGLWSVRVAIAAIPLCCGDPVLVNATAPRVTNTAARIVTR